MHIESSNAYEIPLIETRGKDRWTRKYEEADSIFGRRNREEEEERSREKNNEFDYVSNAE